MNAGDETAAWPPVAILAPGCDGVHDNLDLWTEVTAGAARAGDIAVDGACHGFDRKERAAIGALSFDAGATDSAIASVEAYLAARPER